MISTPSKRRLGFFFSPTWSELTCKARASRAAPSSSESVGAESSSIRAYPGSSVPYTSRNMCSTAPSFAFFASR